MKRNKQSVSDEFPPRSNHIDEIEVLLTFLQSIIPNQNAVYVSAPITSGRRYIEWVNKHPQNRNFSGNNQNSEFVSNVIEVNRKHAESVIKRMSALFSEKVLINPTAVPDVSGWNQNDYRYAWGRIIKQYTKILVLSDDWHFSCGCIYEFFIGKSIGIKVIDEKAQEISLLRGLELINEAINFMKFKDLPISFHKSVYSELAGRKTVEALI